MSRQRRVDALEAHLAATEPSPPMIIRCFDHEGRRCETGRLYDPSLVFDDGVYVFDESPDAIVCTMHLDRHIDPSTGEAHARDGRQP